MRNLKNIRVLLLMLIISLALSFGKTALARDIILNDLDGQEVNLSRDNKGKPVILFFWTTWCPFCRVELKKLNQQADQIAQEGIILFGVNENEPEYKVQKFFKNYQLNLRVLLDKSGVLADQYDLLGVPTYVFLDKSGRLISEEHTLPSNYKSLFFKQMPKK